MCNPFPFAPAGVEEDDGGVTSGDDTARVASGFPFDGKVPESPGVVVGGDGLAVERIDRHARTGRSFISPQCHDLTCNVGAQQVADEEPPERHVLTR